jgi:hypothetical protein
VVRQCVALLAPGASQLRPAAEDVHPFGSLLRDRGTHRCAPPHEHASEPPRPPRHRLCHRRGPRVGGGVPAGGRQRRRVRANRWAAGLVLEWGSSFVPRGAPGGMQRTAYAIAHRRPCVWAAFRRAQRRASGRPLKALDCCRPARLTSPPARLAVCRRPGRRGGAAADPGIWGRPRRGEAGCRLRNGRARRALGAGGLGARWSACAARRLWFQAKR